MLDFKLAVKLSAPFHLLTALLISFSLSYQALATDLPDQKLSSEKEHQLYEQQLDQAKQPAFQPLMERYILDELKSLRIDMSAWKIELNRDILDRELAVADKSMSYATDTVTYFFYVIAGATSVLVFLGWNSIRDIKDRIQVVADEEIKKVVSEYEKRLAKLEYELTKKSRVINKNREDLEKANEAHSLWLRASIEKTPENRIAIFDQILQLSPGDANALIYKADAALEQDDPQWAISLCRQALAMDEENGHAFYQLACAHAALGELKEAIDFLTQAIDYANSYREIATQDLAFEQIREEPKFRKLVYLDSATQAIMETQGMEP